MEILNYGLCVIGLSLWNYGTIELCFFRLWSYITMQVSNYETTELLECGTKEL